RPTTRRAAMRTAGRAVGVVASVGTLHAVRGRAGSSPLATVEAYDPGTDTWTARASLPTPRAGLGVAAINGTLYAVGGFNSATVEAFSPSAVFNAAQTITFNPLGDRTVADPDFSVGATASSGLGVTFSASGSCTVSGSTVHLVGAGSCTVTALQPGDEN